jgi:hypothetical protein
MERRRFLSMLAALPLAGLIPRPRPPITLSVKTTGQREAKALADVLGGPYAHWATPHATPLADILAMRDRVRAASVGWSNEWPEGWGESC